MYKTFPTLIFSLICAFSFAQKSKDLNINYMLRGQIYAKSSMDDKEALGGFGGSGNAAKKIKDNSFTNEKELFLKIDTSKIDSTSFKYTSYQLYLGNKSDSVASFGASDSRLSVIAEVFYDNKWQAIEYLPSSWCGNSYHTVYLKQNEYWSFAVPVFSGKTKVKLRYRLIINQNKSIYSNEIYCSFNKEQLTEKEGHTPNGIMDPYTE